MATEWISRTSGRIRFTLRLCRLPMKSQVKRVAVALALGLEVLEAVLADQLDPGLGERPHLLGGTYLVAARISTSAPQRSRTRSRLRRTVAGVDVADRLRPSIQTSPAWRPVRPPSRRWEKKSSGSQLVQRPLDSTALDPGAREQAARDLGQVEHAARRRPRRRARANAASTSSPTS